MKKILALVAVAGVATAAHGQIWDSGTGLGWSITDNTTVDRAFSPDVFGSTVTQFDIFMSPLHTWRGDLVITLIAPDASSRILTNRIGGSGDFITAFFADSGVVLPTSGNLDSNTSGILYQASGGSLGVLNAAAGIWTLRVQDAATGDIGTIDRIRLHTIPTPGALALLGMGGLLVGRRRR